MTIGPSLAAALATLAVAQAAPAASPPPAAAAAAETPKLPYELFRLPNGLTVILHEDHGAPLVGVHVQYDVGSKDERPGRTGFAHLFEHLMFQGTEHLPKGLEDRLVDAAGGDANGSTSQDTTVYWEQVPSNALEQMLFIGSDRMGFLLPTLDQAKLDNQRDVVRNERRQSYEMQPYGLAFDRILSNLWTNDFPYHWMTIGSHEDLEAATLEDVRHFFERWYGPENAVLSVAGDIDPARTRALVEKWFAGIPGKARPVHQLPSPQPLAQEKRVTMQDRVQLPRLYLAWQTPKVFAPGDAALDLLGQILTDGKSARLVKRLVMDEQIAQSVSAGQSSEALAGMFLVVATPKPGVPVARLEKEIDEELARIARVPPSAEELERAKNKIEAAAVFGLEPVGGFGGRAATLANYFVRAGDPGYLEQDLARYRLATAADVSMAARTFLRKDARVVLTVVPAAGGSAPAAQGSAR
ncbi:M16 family metallopeptidase [Anaeromyxobacter oryzisoli]|uniref:M16 family metallopeptidase n=1 Tax=Anaeromyxobacter oryzisoli TaxID=2925408 RepID=UPI001F575945|nr:pitrilysin family protein [Anaeromyxobacter sp. SG63]